MKKLLVTFIFLLLTTFVNAQWRNVGKEKYRNQGIQANITDITKHLLGWSCMEPTLAPEPVELIQLKAYQNRPLIAKLVEVRKGVFDVCRQYLKSDKDTETVDLAFSISMKDIMQQISMEIDVEKNYRQFIRYLQSKFDGDLFMRATQQPLE
jgi:hypothetical protein